jgi:hypothetical protein
LTAERQAQRPLVAYEVNVLIDLQDDGPTMKVFLTDRDPT